jgi:large subunit ribosomal protein L20
MPRAKGGFKTRRRRNRVLKQAEGYWGKRKSSFRSAQEAVDRALAYSYRDRRNRKRDFRSLWVVRINAAARLAGLSYSRLMSGLRRAGVAIDRKVLADLAVRDAAAFTQLAELAKSQAAA